MLLVLAWFLGDSLPPHTGGNDYLGFVFLAVLLVVDAVPFGIAFLLPNRKARMRVSLAALGMLLIVWAFGTWLLFDGLAAPDRAVGLAHDSWERDHVLGLLALWAVGVAILTGSFVLRDDAARG